MTKEKKTSLLSRIIRLCLEQKLIVFSMTILIIVAGLAVAPFDWQFKLIPRNAVGVDAVPDISDNLQIVFSEWTGRSPQDVEDQITYPLTTALLGVPGVKSVRSYSFFGFSTINIIFDDDIDFYWSRSRILEKLNSLPPGTLPDEVQPALGPDATSLGQIFWYTLEGRDAEGNATGGWDLDELRTQQDWYVRYALLSAGGVSEVASIGGYVKAYYVDVDPDSLRAYNVSIQDVFNAVKKANLDVGARTIEINQVEYFIRGIGFIKSLDDVENAVIETRNSLPVRVKDVAVVSYGPHIRRGALDKEGAEAVGGIVISRFGENSLQVIKNVKKKIGEFAPSLPKKTLEDGTVSQVTIVPYYDRTGLIYETLGTLNTALLEEILVTIIVILIGVMHLRSSLLIALMLPLSVLMTFIAMKIFGVDANIVSLSGIAIAVGTIVSMGIFICENILRVIQESPKNIPRLEIIHKAATEVGGAVLTAAATTIVSFLPVFSMIGPEGKLFKPLAFTKTFVLIASIITALLILPPLAQVIFMRRDEFRRWPKIGRIIATSLLIALGVLVTIFVKWWIGVLLIGTGIYGLCISYIPQYLGQKIRIGVNSLVILLVGFLLTRYWLPLGPEKGFIQNFLFLSLILGTTLLLFYLFQRLYPSLLRWCLHHKGKALFFPFVLILLGMFMWLGVPTSFRSTGIGQSIANYFPGLGKEFMPPLDEGSYLYMPITMPHAGTGEVEEILQFQDTAITSIAEVQEVVGKWGRAETPLDPAPISMFETVINYYPKYSVDNSGKRLRFKFDPRAIDYFRDEKGTPLLADDQKPYYVQGKFERDEKGRLILARDGVPFRLWRPRLNPQLNPGREAWKGINNTNDIWIEIEKAAALTGVTAAPKLQPIAARIVMLQSGMRAPMGIKVRGPSLEVIEEFGLKLEKYLKEIPSIYEPAVIADRIIGKPYLEFEIDRDQIDRYGLMIDDVQKTIEIALGGTLTTRTVEGRERFPVRVRYLRELRDTPEAMDRILFTSPSGEQIPLTQLAKIQYVRGPQVIKSEETFLVGYVLFDKLEGFAEVDVVEEAQKYLHEKIAQGELSVPEGVTFAFSGSYENQVRAQKKLTVILPLALFFILLILYLQFNSILTSLAVFTGIIVAWSGGFVLLWLYGEPWFMNFTLFGEPIRELFQIHPINLSIAVWVGFLVLFGIATDNGVILATSINQTLRDTSDHSIEKIRQAVWQGSIKRIRPVVMTSATTILALLPVLTSTGRGSDVMVPMAIPSFGGMVIAVISLIVVPVLQCWMAEMTTKVKQYLANGRGE